MLINNKHADFFFFFYISMNTCAKENIQWFCLRNLKSTNCRSGWFTGPYVGLHTNHHTVAILLIFWLFKIKTVSAVVFFFNEKLGQSSVSKHIIDSHVKRIKESLYYLNFGVPLAHFIFSLLYLITKEAQTTEVCA